MRFFATVITSAAAYLATPNEFIASKSSHCDSEIVATTCGSMTAGASTEEVTLAQLKTYFAAEKIYEDEIKEWLERFGLQATSEGAYSCKQLCRTAVFKYAAQLPWTIDTGCKHAVSEDDAAKAVTVCDVDLDFEHLKDLKFQDDKDGHKDTVQEHGEHSGKGAEEDLDVIFQRMDKTTLRGFRSFPLSDISVDFSEEGEAVAKKEGVDVPTAMAKKTESPLEAKVETHVSAFLQMKQQAAPSFLQTESASAAYSVACVHDAEFRASSGLCPAFLDEKQIFAQMQAKAPQLAGASFEQSHTGCPSTCALSGHMAAGCESCSAFVEMGVQRVAKVQAKTGQVGWKQDVAKVSIKAQAYLAHVSEGMSHHAYDRELTKWYGTDSGAVRKEVRRILQSVLNMIDHVDYVYPGPQCSPNTYAYVYPNAGRGYTFSDDGTKFKFFLCPYYMKVDLGEQVETLTHEGSHHRMAYTDDVPHPTMSGQKAYGRSTCRTLARTNPTSALKNADSFCYFVQDAAESRTPWPNVIDDNTPAPEVPEEMSWGEWIRSFFSKKK